MFNFKSVAKENVGGSPLMVGSPIKTAEILNTPLTIKAVDTIELTKKDGSGKQVVAVFNFVEMPNRYYLGGQALTSMVKAWKDGFISQCEEEGETYSIDKLNNALAKAKVKISLRMTTTRGGNTFVVVDVL